MYSADVTEATRLEADAMTRRPAPRTALVLRAPRSATRVVAAEAVMADMSCVCTGRISREGREEVWRKAGRRHARR